MDKMSLWMVLLTLLIFISLAAGRVMSDEKRLIKYLLENYERIGIHGRPVYNTSETVSVSYGLALIQLMDLNGADQVLVTNVWNRYLWRDLFLRWNPEDFGGVDHLRVPASKIWTPDIVLFNYADTRLTEQRNDALAVVSSDGTVLWIPRAILKSTCSIDITYYPFDEQWCHLKFGSWTYDGFKLDLDFYDAMEAVDITDYIESNEWQVMEHSAKKNTKYYPCCEEPYPDLTFSLRLKRMSTFYSYCLLLPAALLSLFTLVIFWMPPGSSARLILGINIFIALFILMLILPRAWYKPLIGFHLFLNMILVSISAILSVIVMNITSQCGKGFRVPMLLRKVVIDGLAKIMCICRRTESDGGTPPDKVSWDKDSTEKERLMNNDSSNPNHEVWTSSAPEGDDIKEIRDMLKSYFDRISDQQAQRRNAEEWGIIAKVLDRIFFLIYLVVIVIGVIIIIMKA